ncbi:MAG: hypothetical protein EOO78_31840 [Oxalobacteraceae bacterium]|nr:MAG: hypothetical protein EOO78_31840 [Oxalobacteraceae bacterium]
MLGVAALWFVLQTSFAGAARAKYPELALRIAPHDARVLADASALVLTRIEDPNARAVAKAQSLNAIRRDPTSVAALRTLGMIADAEGDSKAALRLINRAEALSRRDVATQLWLIEHYSQADNVAETLRHYDIALATSRQSRDLLIPVLVSASADPALAPGLPKR